MRNKGLLEICAFNIQSCNIAERVGASRVELCDNPIEGGTTPSYGTIKQVRERISILLYPIIRPRSGNYFYDDDEYEIIKKDIEACKAIGCDGISVGAATIHAEIDTEWLKRIVEWASPMKVTCNRVFDGAPDPFKALEDIISCDCERVLTSGQKSSAPDGAEILKQLVEVAGERIIIMPGAGVRSSNLAELKTITGAREFHSSARKIAVNPLTYINNQVTDYGNVYIADEEEIRAMLQVLNNES